jgi:hypothetical protein
MTEGSPLLPLAALVGSMVFSLVSVGAAMFASRGFPAGLRRLARELTERVDAAESDWLRTKGQLTVILEELEELNESIERKRARMAASASKMARDAQPAPDDRDAQLAAIKQRARAQGLI